MGLFCIALNVEILIWGLKCVFCIAVNVEILLWGLFCIAVNMEILLLGLFCIAVNLEIIMRGYYNPPPLPAKKVWGVYRNHPVCLSVQSKLNFGYNFSTNRDKAFILHMLVPCDKTFLSVQKKIDLVTLTLTFDLLLKKKLNLGYNFWTKRDFIVQVCIPCGKAFLSIPKILTLWPWLLTYFWKNLTLTITFEPKVIGL